MVAMLAAGEQGPAAEEPGTPSVARSAKGPWQAGRRPGDIRTLALPGDVGMDFVWVPPGSFEMGSESGHDDEKPVHSVTMTRGFWLARTEVTQAQWSAVMGNNPSRRRGANLPVEQVSWNHCRDYARRISQLVEGVAFRLPTAAEWEHACRAGRKEPAGLPGGEARLREDAWFERNAGGRTHEVGTRKANAWGLFDMHGNVWEWCQDGYLPYSDRPRTDPSASPDAMTHELRGGGWNDAAWLCRSSSRGKGDRVVWSDGIGFRLARPSQ